MKNNLVVVYIKIIACQVAMNKPGITLYNSNVDQLIREMHFCSLRIHSVINAKIAEHKRHQIGCFEYYNSVHLKLIVRHGKTFGN